MTKKNLPICSVELHGVPGSGKTQILCAIHAGLTGYLKGRLRLAKPPNKLAADQIERAARAEPTEPTVPTNGDKLDEYANKEWLHTERLGPGGAPMYEARWVPNAGEEADVAITAGVVADVAGFARQFAGLHILGLTVNPLLVDTEIAKTAFKGVIVRLSRRYAEFERQSRSALSDAPPLLRTAIETAGRVFGLCAEPPKAARAVETVHTIDPSVGERFRHLPADARLEYDPTSGFRVLSAELTQASKDDTLAALDAVAVALAERYRRGLPLLQSLAEQTDRAVPLLTHWDIVHWLKEFVRPQDVRAAGLGAFEREFKRSRVVEVDLFSLQFESDHRRVAAGKLAFWPDRDQRAKKGKSLDQLLVALDELMDGAPTPTPPPPPPVTIPPPTPPPLVSITSKDGGANDCLAEGGYVAARTAALVFAVLAALALLNGWGWPTMWRWFLGGAVAVLVRTLLHFAYTGRPANPAWKIQGEPGHPGHAVAVRSADSVTQLPGVATIRVTPLSSLFDCGWVSFEGRNLLVPELRRFVAYTGAAVEGSPAGAVASLLQMVSLAAAFVLVVVTAVRA